MGDKRLPVIIQSPGGDVQAALAIGRLIRSKKLDVAVGRTAFLRCLPGQKNCQAPKGGYRGMAYSTYAVCASACPLVLAAGGERLVGTLAAAAVRSGEDGLRADGGYLRGEVSDRERQESHLEQNPGCQENLVERDGQIA